MTDNIDNTTPAEGSIIDKAISAPEPENTSEPDYLSALVGEGRKYKDAASLAKAYAHAEPTIEDLKDKLDRERAEYTTKLESMYSVVQQKNTSANSPTVTSPAQPAPEDSGTEKVEVDVSQEVEKALTQREQTLQRKANESDSFSLIEKHYGSKEEAEKALRRSCGKNERLQNIVKELASTDPEAFKQYVTATAAGNSAKSSAPLPSGDTSSYRKENIVNPKSRTEIAKLRREKGMSWYIKHGLPMLREQYDAHGDAYLKT